MIKKVSVGCSWRINAEETDRLNDSTFYLCPSGIVVTSVNGFFKAEHIFKYFYHGEIENVGKFDMKIIEK